MTGGRPRIPRSTELSALGLLANGATTEEAAKLCRVSRSTVERWIKRNGIPYTPRKQLRMSTTGTTFHRVHPDIKAKVAELLREGVSMNAVSERMQVSRSTVRKVAVDNGITVKRSAFVERQMARAKAPAPVKDGEWRRKAAALRWGGALGAYDR